MIKVKDGYAKLIGTTYQGSLNHLLCSNGGTWVVHTDRNNEANKIVRTNDSGHLSVGWVDTTSGDIGTEAINRIYCSTDQYIRYKTPENFFSTLSNDGNSISITVATYNRKLIVAYAEAASELRSNDTRKVNNTPAQFSRGARFEFKENSTDGLNSGGTYHGILHFRPYGSGEDFTGGQTHQLGFTDDGNLWMRTSTSSSSWGIWKLILSQNTADSKYVTALGTNGNYVTWTKNNTVNNLTVPFATSSNILNPSGRKTAISDTTLGNRGLILYQVYSNGYPATYGNLLNIGGLGYGELLCEWKGDASPGHLYYRSKRDVVETAWSQWVTVLDNSNYSSLIGNSYWKVNDRTTKGGGDIFLEMWREDNASWKMLNSGGNLYFQNNWVNGTVGGYFNAFTLSYSSGDALFKGKVTAPALFINPGDSTLKIYDGRSKDGVSDGCIAFQTSIDGTDGQYHPSYPIDHSNRCTIALQPRGGQVSIGIMPTTLFNSGHKLFVQGNSMFVGKVISSVSDWNTSIYGAFIGTPTHSPKYGYGGLVVSAKDAQHGYSITIERENENQQAYIGFPTQTINNGEDTTFLGVDDVTSNFILQYYRNAILRGGNVGIGTESPEAKLHIQGITRVTQELQLYGTTVSSSSWDSANPKIVFGAAQSNGGITQRVALTYTEYDTVRPPAGIRLSGEQGGEWFETPVLHTSKILSPAGEWMLGFTSVGLELGSSVANRKIMIQNSAGTILLNNNGEVSVRPTSYTLNTDARFEIVGSNSRGKYPDVLLHIPNIAYSRMLMNSTGTLEFRAGGPYQNEAFRYLHAAGFIKANSSSDYVLLGDGGHLALSSLSTSHSHNYITSSGLRNAGANGNTRGESGVRLYAAYNNGYPTTYGTVLHLHEGRGAAELLLGWSGTNGAHDNNYVRSKRDNDSGAWSPWALVWTSANLDRSYLENRQINDLNEPHTHASEGARLVYNTYNNQASNKPVSADNANALITLLKSRHGSSGQYSSQLAFPNNARIYYRREQYGTYSNWAEIAYITDIKNPIDYYWANVKVSSSSSEATTPTFNTAYAHNWFRSYNNSGWYNQTYGGGIYMTDSTAVRTYNNKRMIAKNFVANDWNSSSYLLRSDGGAAAFNWVGKDGQPTWLWGGNNMHDYYVYNPSNFSVSYANSAGNADTVNGYHSSKLFRSFGGVSIDFNFSDDNNNNGLYYLHSNYTQSNKNGITYGSLMNFSSGASSWQIISGNNARLYYRNRWWSGGGGAWSAWKTIAYTSDIPSVGNGTVTIYQNNSVKGSFTMNQGGGTSIYLSDTDTNTNYYLTGVSGSGNGSVTFSRSGLSSLTWNSSHSHSYLPNTARGSSTQGIYITSSGTSAAMTYSLHSTVNSGVSGRLAYYSASTIVDDYSSSVGSNFEPIYLNSGVPTRCSYQKIVSNSTSYYIGTNIYVRYSVYRYGNIIIVSGKVFGSGTSHTSRVTLHSGLPNCINVYAGTTLSKGGGSTLRYITIWMEGTRLYVRGGGDGLNSMEDTHWSFCYITNQ